MSIRTERVSKLVQRELAELITTEFSQQLPSLYTITNVRVTKDLSIAYVDVSVYGETKEHREAAYKHLTDLTVPLRSALASRIRHQLRKIPELRFFLDESLQRAMKMENLFDKIRAEREHRTDDSASDDE